MGIPCQTRHIVIVCYRVYTVTLPGLSPESPHFLVQEYSIAVQQEMSARTSQKETIHMWNGQEQSVVKMATHGDCFHLFFQEMVSFHGPTTTRTYTLFQPRQVVWKKSSVLFFTLLGVSSWTRFSTDTLLISHVTYCIYSCKEGGMRRKEQE